MTVESAGNRQIRAADPAQSTWLSANAGSGKTRVLTDRVARLLLNGVAPQHILCLTYTKAAATEMQNRLFARLGAWAMRPDAALAAELAAMGAPGPFPPARLRAARRLFAQALEVPGGLRILTIHAFCAGILRRFPREAGVSPRFVELDDRSAALLRAEVADALAEGSQSAAVDALARQFTGADFDRLLKQIVSRSPALSPPPSAQALARAFGLEQAPTLAELAMLVLDGQERLIDQVAQACGQGGSYDTRDAKKLRRVDLTNPRAEDLARLESVFLFGAGAKDPFGPKIGTFPTKPTRNAYPDLIEPLDDLMQAVAGARPLRINLQAMAKTGVLNDFAAAFLPAYQAAKAARGALDFDDLITRALALLTDPLVAQWVLFRLDGSMDHILVDEAQDTSPAQWQVIERLTEALGSEQDRDGRHQTLFVVGDKKQSIYSFQGADPDRFDTMQALYQQRLQDSPTPLQPLTLDWSFRSSAAILRAVDMTFKGPMGQGLGKQEPSHLAFHADLPGRVDLWPPVLADVTEAEERHWTDPVDQPSPGDPVAILADQVAQAVQRMVASDHIPMVARDGQITRRRVTAGDILILVPRRSQIFGPVIRALKAANVPVAGSDRLRLGAELAVLDIAATLRFLSLPEDDLALAEALKSPLFGWDDQALFTLAHHRPDGAFLWAALRDAAADHPATMAILADLRTQADFLRPHDLIQRLLIRHDGRRRLLARLGPEAEDGIDALLAQALTYEQAQVPSLTGFVEWMLTEDVEVKRSPDTAGGLVRVMTVHGAKGLESPIVILPDTARRKASQADALSGEGAQAFWTVTGTDAPPLLQGLEQRRQLREAEERRRLLYVAMTRAASWLVVCAAGDPGLGDESWHAMIRQGLDQSGAVPTDFPTGPGLRLSHADWDAGPVLMAVAAEKTVSVRADFGPVAVPPIGDAPLSPSDLGGAKTLPGEADGDLAEGALAQGRLVHLLLEHLPHIRAADRPALAARLIDAAEDRLPEADALVADVLALLDADDPGDVFGPDDLVEVALSARLPALGGRLVQGAVDRLQIGPGHIRVIDYKTNRLVPASADRVPEGVLRQMGAYLAMIGAIWPDRRAEVAILWTATATLMPLTPAPCMAALQRAAIP